MKLCNIRVCGEIHLCVKKGDIFLDVTKGGFNYTLDEVISKGILPGEEITANSPEIKEPVFANILNSPKKIVCAGLNYTDHASGMKMKSAARGPVLFSKFSDCLCESGKEISLAKWENSYDYEAELVIVMGKTAYGIEPDMAEEYIFGYTCGNDLSCRDAQMLSTQWLIGKSMPDFAPCGPVIVTRDEWNPERENKVMCRVNGDIRQSAHTTDMMFTCKEIVSHASRYIRLNPGDIIFTGTPGGVMFEKPENKRIWLKPGDKVEIEIEGIGVLENRFI